MCQQAVYFLKEGKDVEFLRQHLADFLSAKYQAASRPEQEFKSYHLLESSKVHLLRFSTVDTTMRIADEFGPAQAYTTTLSEL